jgi:hypothetical protein
VHQRHAPCVYAKSSLPAPRPFSPFSSSSSNRKFRGTLAPMFPDRVRREAVVYCRGCTREDRENQIGFPKFAHDFRPKIE